MVLASIHEYVLMLAINVLQSKWMWPYKSVWHLQSVFDLFRQLSAFQDQVKATSILMPVACLVRNMPKTYPQAVDAAY